MYRTREQQLKYKSERAKKTECPFCKLESERIVEETGDFYVITNKFPYHQWDFCKVKKHLMIVPKKHLVEFEFNEQMEKEYLQLLANYMAQGYDSFTRGTGSTIRTQQHLHTHLIKPGKKPFKYIKFEADPYDLVTK